MKSTIMSARIEPSRPGPCSTTAGSCLIDNLEAASAEEFDDVFLEQQESAHQEALILFRSYASRGDMPELKAAAQRRDPDARGAPRARADGEGDAGGSRLRPQLCIVPCNECSSCETQEEHSAFQRCDLALGADPALLDHAVPAEAVVFLVADRLGEGDERRVAFIGALGLAAVVQGIGLQHADAV